MYCGQCGKEIDDKAAFCPYCGAQTRVGVNTNLNDEKWAAQIQFLEKTAKETFSKVKECGKNIGEKGKSLGESGMKAYREEMASEFRNEYRIMDHKGLHIAMTVLAVVILIFSLIQYFEVFFLNDSFIEGGILYTFLFSIGLLVSMAPVSYFSMLILKVKSSYLSDFLGVFVVNALMSLVELLLYLFVSFNQDLYGYDTSMQSKIVILLLRQIFVTVCYFMMVRVFRKILNQENRRIQLLCLMSFILLSDILGLIWSATHFLLIAYHVCLLLVIVAISNDPNKQYLSKEEPRGKHIKTRSIGFSIILCILTLGIYYILWIYNIMSDIRKMENKNGIAFGEWLLYIFIPFYDWYWLYTRAKKLSVICTNNRLQSTGSGGLFIFLNFIYLGFINTALLQNTLNELAKNMDKDFVYGTVLQQNYIVTQVTKNVGVQGNYMEKLKELNELKEAGIISQEEFEEKKQVFLARM